jgi:hypothetical protein
MKIIIRLVGYTEIIDNNKYVYEYKCNVNTIFNFEILKMIFNKYNNIISVNELNNCTLTCNSKNLKKDFLIDDNTILEDEIINRVFIFTGNTEIKNKLVDIFKINGYKVLFNNILAPNTNNKDSDDESVNTLKNEENEENESNESNETDSNYNDGDEYDGNESSYNEYDGNENELLATKKKIYDTLQQIDSDDSDNESKDLSYENTNLINIKQNLDLLKDNDFVTLLRIYKTREYLFNDFYKYINSSQIIKFNKLEDNIDLTENVNFIKELNLHFQEENIIEALKNTGNHINLAIRYLLYNN